MAKPQGKSMLSMKEGLHVFKRILSYFMPGCQLRVRSRQAMG